MNQALADALRLALGPDAVRLGEPLARYTSLRIGGPAELLIVAADVAALSQALSLAWQHRVPCQVLGGGSNVLVSDAGVPGLTILNRARQISFGIDTVWADSGTALATLARRTVDRGLAGLEWAAGIPGSVGGAVAGNAGAWGGDVASILAEARMLVPGEGEMHWAPGRFGFDYRSSVLRQGSRQAGGAAQPVVLSAAFRLVPGNRTELRNRVAEITVTRRARQPQGATCGSVFKNPPGDYAGRLVEAAGLKGHAQGAAVISPVHANFLVNTGGASAGDAKALIDLACDAVQAQFGLRLELEIELVGTW